MSKWTIAVWTALALLLVSSAAIAQEQATGWQDTAEFGFVATDGNTESSSLGFKNTLSRNWERSDMVIRLGGIRVKTTTFTRTAVDGVVTEDKTSAVQAENYYLNGRYNRSITERMFWYAGAGWERNEPAGIQNRYVVEGGAGNTWYNAEELTFKTTYGVTYTDQEDVVTDPTREKSFAGLRFAWDYLNKFGKNTTFTNVLVLDGNLEESSRWRGDTNFGLAVAMSERLALKAGLQFLYNNEPALELVPNVDGVGNPLDPVPYELEKLDSILTVSLVVDFK